MINKEKINLVSLKFENKEFELKYKKYSWKTEKRYFLIKNYIAIIAVIFQILLFDLINEAFVEKDTLMLAELIMLITILISSAYLILSSHKFKFKYGNSILIMAIILFFSFYNIQRFFFYDSSIFTLDGISMFSIPAIYLTWVIILFSLVKSDFRVMLILYFICAFPWLITFYFISNSSPSEIFVIHLFPTFFVILNYYQKELKIRQNFYYENLMNSSLKKYFGKDLTEQLIKNDGKIKGANKWVTISFIDIVSYSNIIEKMSPEVAVEFLNEYFTKMHSVIKEYNGVILNYIGDCVMVVFGAPKNVRNHEILAVQSALEMRAMLEKLNSEWDQKEFSRYWKNIGIKSIKFRIGIHSGNLIIGNIGSKDLLQYSAIGDVVNIASRLEKINKEFNTDIAISEEVFAALTQKYSKNAKLQSEISLKGKTKSTKVYTL